MKTIVITSYFFLENTPRGFRTFELVKEFLRRGYEVELYIPESKSKIFVHKNLKIHFIKKKSILEKNYQNIILRVIFGVLRRLIMYFFGSLNPFYFILLFKELKKISSSRINGVIAIGLPFTVIFGTGLWIKYKNIPVVSVADYGDPFYYQSYQKMLLINRVIEKKVLNNFKYITIPTEKVLNSYLNYKNKDSIKIIPQGFNFDEIKVKDYKKNEVPTFAYAGIFYKKIREPEKMFEFLLKTKKDFKFYLYINREQIKIFNIDKYKDKLGEKLIIKNFIPRNELLYELGEMDFLINLNNVGCNQIPSKIIDYSIIKKPILNFTEDINSLKIFDEFLNGNYTNALKIDVNKYDIKKIVDNFIKLLKI